MNYNRTRRVDRRRQEEQGRHEAEGKPGSYSHVPKETGNNRPPQDKPETKSSIEDVLDTVLAELEADMDRSFMETGKTVETVLIHTDTFLFCVHR